MLNRNNERLKNKPAPLDLYISNDITISDSDYYSEILTPSSENQNKSTSWQRRKRRRIVTKSGNWNIKVKLSGSSSTTRNISIHLQDLFTSLVELRWRWMLLWVSLCHVISWFLFAFLWWIIAYNHGDLRSSKIKNPYNDPELCVIGVDNFVNGFLFSVETQFTTGYGTRVPTATCPDAICLLVIQNIFGAILSCLTLGLVFTKAARSKSRQASIMFSKNAVICLRDGKLRLLFRVADMRKSTIMNADVRASFVSAHRTLEGELIPHYQRKLTFAVDENEPDTCFAWPTTLCHTIDDGSPLYDISAIGMMQSHFEIIVRLTGTLQTTGQLMEVSTSYLPAEILWGHKFQSFLIKSSYKNNRADNGYVIDYDKFETTKMVDTPVCSARQISQIRKCWYTKEPTYDTIYE